MSGRLNYYSKNYGGAREGAGRPSLGSRKVVSITLPDQVWDEINLSIEQGEAKNISDYFRKLILRGGVSHEDRG